MEKSGTISTNKIIQEWNKLVARLGGVEKTDIVPFIAIKTFISFKSQSEEAKELRQILSKKEEEFESKIGHKLPGIRWEQIYI